MTHAESVAFYLEQMTDIEPHLPPEEQASLQAWYRSPNFRRDSDWPGWAKYLGPRPERRKLQIVAMPKRRSA